jgi:hypothetical protein
VSTGNPLKDMLNAQIRSRQGGASVPDQPNESNQFTPPVIVSPVASSIVSKPPPPPEEDDDVEDEDMFSTRDDPYSLFGAPSRVTSQRVSISFPYTFRIFTDFSLVQSEDRKRFFGQSFR